MALATYNLTTGTAVFGLALPEGQAVAGVKVGALDTQTDIKTTWDDGSIRFCIVSCVVPSDGDYDIIAGAATSGSFTPTWPSASVAFDLGADTYTATLPSLTTSDPWLVGPHAKEYRVKVVPLNGVTPHVALEVIFDVRSYQTGGHRVDVTAQSVVDVADNNAFTYDLTVTVGGSSVLTKSACDHRVTTRWRRAFTTGTPALSTVTPDFEPFHVSYAIPRYSASVADDAWASVSDPDYDILEFGDMDPGMGNPGGRPELAYFPSWCAQYVVHKDADAYAYMIRQAELSGSWCGHLTKSDGSSIKLTDWPDFWLDGRAGTNPNGPNITRGAFDFLQGWGDYLEQNHIPQLCLIPYLVTGDRYFLDQMRFWAHFCLLVTYPGDGWRNYTTGTGSSGMHLYPNQVRGVAWGLRTLAEIATFLPDGDTDKSYFAAATESNLIFLDWVSTTLDPGGPLGIPLVSAATGGATALAVVSWQNDYVAYGLDRCHQLGFTDGLALKTQLATWRVRLLTTSGTWDRSYGCPYWMPFPPEEPGVGSQSSAGLNPSDSGGPTVPAGVSRTWKTMSEIWDDNMTGDPSNVDGPYGGEALVGLRIAIQLGLTGAQTAYDYLEPLANPVHSGWELTGVNGTEDVPPPAPTFIRRSRLRFRA
jgi:hypothetical protein